MWPKGMEDLATFSVREVKRGKRQAFLCRRTVRVKVKGKVIPASFLKIEERYVRRGKRLEKEGWLIEFVGDQNSGPEALPRSKRGQEWREQRSDGEE